jgi:hypothetical protein
MRLHRRLPSQQSSPARVTSGALCLSPRGERSSFCRAVPARRSMEQALRHIAAGIGEWAWASNGRGEPDVVMACAGDVPTLETLAKVALLRLHLLELALRVVNVVDLMKLQSAREMNLLEGANLWRVDRSQLHHHRLRNTRAAPGCRTRPRMHAIRSSRARLLRGCCPASPRRRGLECRLETRTA